jgi:hypothetical protein
MPCSDVISAKDIADMKEAYAIVNPIRQFTDKLQSDSIPTLSLVMPGLLSLVEAVGKGTGLSDVRRKLAERIQTRFEDILRSGQTASDPIYIAAAVLDPSIAYRIREKREEAKQALKSLIVQYGAQQAEDAENEGEALAMEESEFGFEVAPVHVEQQMTGVDDEISRYLTYVLRAKVCANGFDFWNGQEGTV